MQASLIFLHGGPGYQDYLRLFFEGRFSPGIRTVFYTQVQAVAPSAIDRGVDGLVDELETIIEGQSGPVVLVGHSWGGVLATEFLRRKGEPSGG